MRWQDCTPPSVLAITSRQPSHLLVRKLILLWQQFLCFNIRDSPCKNYVLGTADDFFPPTLRSQCQGSANTILAWHPWSGLQVQEDPLSNVVVGGEGGKMKFPLERKPGIVQDGPQFRKKATQGTTLPKPLNWLKFRIRDILLLLFLFRRGERFTLLPHPEFC